MGKKQNADEQQQKRQQLIDAVDKLKSTPPKNNEKHTVLDIVENDLNCSICNDIFSTPVTTNCGHVFCDDCLEKWAKNNGGIRKTTCPDCRAPIKVRTRNHYIENLIEKLLSKLSEIQKEEQQSAQEPTTSDTKLESPKKPTSPSMAPSIESPPRPTETSPKPLSTLPPMTPCGFQQDPPSSLSLIPPDIQPKPPSPLPPMTPFGFQQDPPSSLPFTPPGSPPKRPSPLPLTIPPGITPGPSSSSPPVISLTIPPSAPSLSVPTQLIGEMPQLQSAYWRKLISPPSLPPSSPPTPSEPPKKKNVLKESSHKKNMPNKSKKNVPNKNGNV